MEEMPCYGRLIIAQALQQAMSGTGANGLDSCAGSTDASAAMIQFATFEEKCFVVVGVSGNHQAFDAEVNANYTPGGFWFRDFGFVC